MLSEQVMNEFLESMEFIRDHHLMEQHDDDCRYSDFHLGLFDCLRVEVVRVDPLTMEISDNCENNTKVQVWIEFGFPELSEEWGARERFWISSHDISLDVGADTFEEAIILLAKRIKEKYK